MSALVTHPVMVDGEPVDVLDEASVQRLVRDPALAGAPLERWIRGTAETVATHSGFALAAHAVGPRATRLWMVLLRLDDRWVRVHLEHLTCARCGTQVLAANPTVEDMFLGLADKPGARAAAWQLPAVPCPQCGAAFDRHAVWVERLGAPGPAPTP